MADSNSIRLGIDFGYGYTGVCLLDSDNCALGAAVVKHDTTLSELLISRRANRTIRRRAQSRRRRLRDCYALLAEMDCAPAPFVKDADKGGKAERKKELPANRLYALMHRRGWDYADVLELLFDEENGKPGRAVGDIDNLLIEEGAPALLPPKPPTKNRKESPAQFAKRQESYKRAVANHEAGKLPDQEDLRWLKIKEPCLGYLSDLAKQERELVKRLEKNPDDESEDELSRVRAELESESRFWENAELGAMENKIGERIDAAFADASPEKRKELTDDIMAILGLTDSRKRFKDGKEYRPNRNQHRTKMLDELDKLFDEVAAAAPAAEVAAREGREAGDVVASWKTRMKDIADWEYRKKRFLNRKLGKCPAKIGDGADENRCGKNLPKRARLDIRKLLFETEARQMNIVVAGQEKSKKPETRKLSDEEIAELLGCVEWDAKGNKIKPAEWAAFFKRNKPLPPKKDESGEEHRGKKDALRDIAVGAQAGRTNLCAAHIAARLELVKRRNRLDKQEADDDGELPAELQQEWENWQQEWNAMHGERIIDQTDAPPSLRQKVDRVCAVVGQLIKNAHREGAPIAHIGIESARFDIHSLSAREGRKSKNKASYSKSRGSDLPALKRAQDNMCFYCGDTLGANATVDHVFPKAGRGGDVWLNRVAACSACNINKWRLQTIAVNDAALAALEAKHPKKAEHIKKRLDSDNKLPPDNLAAPVQTMFGAKVLRGALAKAFEKELKDGKEDDVNQFPKIRASDAAHLRRLWFPFMARQKAALREAERRKEAGDKLVAYVGEEFKLDADDLKKIGVLRAEKCEVADANQEGVLEARVNDDGALVVDAPVADAIGKRKIRIYGECERVYHLKDGESKKEKFIPREFAPEIKEQTGVCAEIEDVVRDDGEIRWQRLILRADGKAKSGKATITLAAWDIRLLVCPRRADKKARQSEDPIYKFHHIMDAAVVAANVDWEKIARLARDSKERDERSRTVLAEQGLGVAPPDLFAIFPPEQRREDGDFCAPLLGDWLIVDRRDKSGPKAAKTKREPVRYKADKDGKMIVSQRVPLDRITRKEIDRIAPGGEKIKAALLAEWAEIDERMEKMSKEESAEFRKKFISGSGDNAVILGAWFLQLPPEHFLRPNRKGAPRSVRVKEYKQTAPFAVQRREYSALGRRTHRHYFDREESWGSVVIFRGDNGAEAAFRRRPDFYINAANRGDEWDYDPKDKRDKRPPPDPDRKVRVFHRRDWVGVADAESKDDLPGLWRLMKFSDDKNAALEAADDEARAAGKASSQSATFINHGYVNVDYCRLQRAKKPA